MKSDSRIVQLRNGDLSILPTYVVLLFTGVVIGAALAFFRAYVLRSGWPGLRYFTAGSKLRWILCGILAGIPHGFLIQWKQQVDSPLEAAFSTTIRFIAVPLIIIVTFWLVFRLDPLPHQNLTGSEEGANTT